MNFNEALDIVTEFLKKNRKATNSSILEMIGKNLVLFEKIIEHLIFNDLAGDIKGMGLVFTEPDTGDQKTLQPDDHKPYTRHHRRQVRL